MSIYKSQAITSDTSKLCSPYLSLLPVQRADAISAKYRKGFFIYEKTSDHKSCFGLLCSLPLSTRFKEAILPHEQIHQEHVHKLYQSFQSSHIQKNPILLLTDEDEFLPFLHSCKRNAKCIKEVKQDHFTHRILFVHNTRNSYELINTLFLADGHHRYTAFVQLGNSIPKSSIMAAIFHVNNVETKGLGILLNLPEYLHQQIMRRITQISEISTKKTDISLIKDGKIFNFVFQEKIKTRFLENCLDIELFHHFFFHDFLEINKSNPSSIQFIREPEEGFNQSHIIGTRLGFLLPKISPLKLLELARSKKTLPPNTTFFEPKIINNLITHKILEL